VLDAKLNDVVHWSQISKFVERSSEAKRMSSAHKRKYLRVLNEMDTMVISLLLVRRLWTNDACYSLNELAGTLEDERDASRQRSARESLMKKFKPAFEAFGLAHFKQINSGRQKYQIAATERLAEFVGEHFLAKIAMQLQELHA
jgi:hypothetical protein